MKNILITGTTGLVGQHLLPLLQQQHTIFNISRTPLTDNQQTSSHNIHLDLSGSWDSTVLPGSVDAVIHLAQSEHFRDFPEKAANIFEINTVSTLKLLNYARKAGAKTIIDSPDEIIEIAKR